MLLGDQTPASVVPQRAAAPLALQLNRIGETNVIPRSLGWAEISMITSGVLLLAGYMCHAPLWLLIGYMVIATTLVLVALGIRLRDSRRSSQSNCPATGQRS